MALRSIECLPPANTPVTFWKFAKRDSELRFSKVKYIFEDIFIPMIYGLTLVTRLATINSRCIIDCEN